MFLFPGRLPYTSCAQAIALMIFIKVIITSIETSAKLSPSLCNFTITVRIQIIPFISGIKNTWGLFHLMYDVEFFKVIEDVLEVL